MKQFFSAFQNQTFGFNSGQTLIETIVALGLLTTGLVAGLGLVVYSVATSESNSKQIIGMNLAREGIEVVRNMRDSNWLNDTLDVAGTSAECSAIGTGQPCYPDWDDELYFPTPSFIQSYDIAGSIGSGTNYTVRFAYLEPWRWTISPNSIFTCNNYRLYTNSNGTYTHKDWPLGSPSCNSNSNTYYRQINITRMPPGAGFNANNPRLRVTSTVWWKGKGCPATDSPPSGSRCKVVLQEYLTNWKNY